MQSREELIITALQERVGQLAASYELQIAMLRAELTTFANEKEEKEKAIAEYSNSIESKIGEIN
jgi:hypothetical protein